MARPVKCRRVGSLPEVTYLKPAGIPLRDLEDVGLTVEEAEAIRLKDLEELKQEEAAERMHISRPTFHRVLRSARYKVADVLLNGKALRIEGGTFALDRQPFRCREDGHEWQVRFEDMVAGRHLACPRCESSSVVAVDPRAAWGGPGRGRRRHRGDGRGQRASVPRR
jgi:predicted DNA-binding protein (UPF0251 family)